MLPETMISGVYTGLAAAHAATAVGTQEIVIAALYLVAAVVYLFAPYLRRHT
jgi:hypothetical protein